MTLHINWGPALHEIRREPVGEKWCFGCCKHLPHDFVVTAPIERSYYGPNWVYECSRCKKDLTDFPGQERSREWVE